MKRRNEVGVITVSWNREERAEQVASSKNAKSISSIPAASFQLYSADPPLREKTARQSADEQNVQMNTSIASLTNVPRH